MLKPGRFPYRTNIRVVRLEVNVVKKRITVLFFKPPDFAEVDIELEWFSLRRALRKINALINAQLRHLKNCDLRGIGARDDKGQAVLAQHGLKLPDRQLFLDTVCHLPGGSALEPVDEFRF